jgi:hypothetical protein
MICAALWHLRYVKRLPPLEAIAGPDGTDHSGEGFRRMDDSALLRDPFDV